jgi:amino acid adenylation domain-containing protein
MKSASEVAVDRQESVASSAEVEQSIPKRFAQMVALHADQMAVSANGAEWTYTELDQCSNGLAAQILERAGSEPEPVVLLMEHGAPLIAAILAVLKAGKIYLALDPSDAIERLSAMLSDSCARLLIADQKNAGIAGSLAAERLPIFVTPRDFSEPSTHTNFPEVSGGAGAWLMYTSGSTGTPRGVWENHRGVVHYANVYSKLIQLGPEDRLSLLTSCSFAASATPLFTALLNGATLCPFSVRSHGVEGLAIWLREQGITIYQSVPTVFRHLARVTDDNGIFARLRVVRLAGEPVLRCDVEMFRRRCPDHCRLMNALASTETGPISAAMIDKQTVLPEGRVPVGRAVRDVEIFLVNEQGQVVENGCDGRIAVRSAYLRQGYWRRPDETLEKFQMSLRAPGTTIFITNDLGRFLPDGNLEHLGRVDEVVKIAGLWLNPAEIESELMRIPGVREVAAIAVDDGQGIKSVAAFLSWNATPWPEQSLRLKLRKQLPLHSVPSRFFTLEQLPLLPSGKIDRVALSSKATELMRWGSSKADPDDVLELQMVRIWEKVLAVEAVATTDDFFALGGDSLAAATMLAAVEKFCGVDLPTSCLLEASTIKKLTDLIRSGGLGESDLWLVALRLSGTKPPLYCVPSGNGDALEFRIVAGNLTNDQPVFTFQARGLDGRSPCLRSVEEMAKSYVETMRVHQPRGPYYLCGVSFGGVVAFEMAKRLVAEGQEVAFLGLLDSFAGEYPKPRRSLTPRKRLELALPRFRFLPYDKRDLSAVFSFLFAVVSFKKGIRQWINRCLILKRNIREFMRRSFIRRLVNLDSLLNFRIMRCPHELRAAYFREVCIAARRRYKLMPFTGKIDLFRAEQQPPSDLFEEDPLLGWSGMAAGGIEVHQFPGNHWMYLVKPAIAAVVAAQLEACLEKRRTEISARKHD